MSVLTKYHFQVIALDTSASSIDDNRAVLSSGIINTGNITSTGTTETTGGVISTDQNGNRSIATFKDLGGGSTIWTFTRL